MEEKKNYKKEITNELQSISTEVEEGEIIEAYEEAVQDLNLKTLDYNQLIEELGTPREFINFYIKEKFSQEIKKNGYKTTPIAPAAIQVNYSILKQKATDITRKSYSKGRQILTPKRLFIISNIILVLIITYLLLLVMVPRNVEFDYHRIYTRSEDGRLSIIDATFDQDGDMYILLAYNTLIHARDGFTEEIISMPFLESRWLINRLIPLENGVRVLLYFENVSNSTTTIIFYDYDKIQEIWSQQSPVVYETPTICSEAPCEKQWDQFYTNYDADNMVMYDVYKKSGESLNLEIYRIEGAEVINYTIQSTDIFGFELKELIPGNGLVYDGQLYLVLVDEVNRTGIAFTNDINYEYELIGDLDQYQENLSEQLKYTQNEEEYNEISRKIDSATLLETANVSITLLDNQIRDNYILNVTSIYHPGIKLYQLENKIYAGKLNGGFNGSIDNSFILHELKNNNNQLQIIDSISRKHIERNKRINSIGLSTLDNELVVYEWPDNEKDLIVKTSNNQSMIVPKSQLPGPSDPFGGSVWSPDTGTKSTFSSKINIKTKEGSSPNIVYAIRDNYDNRYSWIFKYETHSIISIGDTLNYKEKPLFNPKEEEIWMRFNLILILLIISWIFVAKKIKIK